MMIYRHNMRMEIDYQAIGKRIRDRRSNMGYSQELLAFECDLSVPYISQIENGRKSVSLHALLQIADSLDCTLDFLIFGTSSFYISSKEYDFNETVENCSKEERKYLYDLLSLNIKMLQSQRAQEANNS